MHGSPSFLLTSSANMCIDASSNTVLNPFICQIAFDHIGKVYSIIDIILALNGFHPPIFTIILISSLWLMDAFSIKWQTCLIKPCFNFSNRYVFMSSPLFHLRLKVKVGELLVELSQYSVKTWCV